MPLTKRLARLQVESLEDRCTPATFTVVNLKDAGAGSLRQAIVNANNHAGPDTVVFKAGLEGTIRLTSGSMAITGGLFLDGPGANKIAIDGNRNDRIFVIDAATTLDGLTLVNGKAAGNGGAIFSSAPLRLIGMVITGNVAELGGGAIDSYRTSLTIQKSRISGNSAANGGGFVAWGKTLVEDSTISSNQATNESGGGIYAVFGETSLTLRRVMISGNIAKTDGGGVYADATTSSVVIERSSIEGNQAGRWGGGFMTAGPKTTVVDSMIRYNRSESTGGGLASNGSTTIQRSTISGNVAFNGPAGGISQYLGSLFMVDSTVSGNRAENDRAGGILIDNITGASTIRRSTIANNWAKLGAGAYLSNLSVIVSFELSTISGNFASQAGGGVYVHNPSVTSVLFINNCTIAFNRADTVGGGIWSIDLSNPTKAVILGSTIVANNDAPTGPDTYALFFAGSSLVSVDPGADMIDDASQGANLRGVDPRLAPLANNGGLTQTHALRRGSPAINKGSNSGAWTTDQRGGKFARKVGPAVDIGAYEWVNTPLPPAAKGTFVVSNLNDAGGGSLRQAIIDANNRPGFDTIVFHPALEGSIKLTSGVMNITSSLLIDGPGAGKLTVDGNRNGRIFNVVNENMPIDVTIEGLTLFNGRAVGGGAILNSAKLTLIGAIITGNVAADGNGGAIGSNGNLTVRQSRISGNACELYDGGGIAVRGNALIDQSTISNNRAHKMGGGLFLAQGNLTVRKSTITGNGAVTSSGGGIAASFAADNFVMEGSVVDGNQAHGAGGGILTSVPVATINDSKIRNNICDDAGGGLAGNFDVQIRRSTINGNISRNGPAGGISQFGGSLFLLDSTVSSNSALAGDGGGICIDSTEFNSFIRRSTIANNRAKNGGGVSVANVPSVVYIQNSTVSDNMATALGGGMSVSRSPDFAFHVTVQSSTIAFNRAQNGGGIRTAIANRISLQSAIVASNAAAEPSPANNHPDLLCDDYYSFGFHLANSLVGKVTQPPTITDEGKNLLGADPRLAPLANNGGLTATHALKKGSQAINRGYNPAAMTTDQRGGKFKRLLGPKVDIGAYERE